MSSESDLYFLHRVATPPGPEDNPDEVEFLSLGPPDEVSRRLLSLPGMSRPRRSASRKQHPPREASLVFKRDGRRMRVSLTQDEKGGILGVDVDEACREDMAEIASVFDGGEGVLVVFDSEGGWHSLEDLQPQAPPSAGVQVTRPSSKRTQAPLTLEWKATLEERIYPLGLYPMAEGLVVKEDHRLLALDTATGQTRWTTRLTSESPLVTATDTLLLVGGDHPTVRALDPRTGAERWTVQVIGDLSEAPCVLGDGQVALTTQFGQLTVVSAEGLVRWRVELGPMSRNRPFLVGDLLLVVARDGQLSVLHAPTGRVLRQLSVFDLLASDGAQRNRPFGFHFRNIAGRLFLIGTVGSVELHLPEFTPGLRIPQSSGILHELSGRAVLFQSEALPRAPSAAPVPMRHRLSVISLPELTELWEGSSLGEPLGVPVEVSGRWALLSTPPLSKRKRPLSLQLVSPESGAALHSLVLREVGMERAALAARGDQVFVSVGGDVWCVRVGA